MISLGKKYPCRSSFIKNLYDFISYDKECLPPVIFIYGHAGTGKTVIVKDFLRNVITDMNIRGVYVDSVECYNPKRILENLLEEFTYGINGEQRMRCDCIKDFVDIFRNYDNQGKFIFAVDNADRLRDMDANILPILLRLQEISALNVCILLISQIPVEKYYCKTSSFEIITLHFPQYSKKEIFKILGTQFKIAKNTLKNHIKERSNNDNEFTQQILILKKITYEVFNNYLNVFLSVFYKACRDVPELKIKACNCFLKYVEPVFTGSVDIRDVSKLWRSISLPLRYALSMVYMRFDETEKKILTAITDVNCLEGSIQKMARSLELPFYGKYLLISAFLAGHNSIKEDKRLFVKHHEKQRKCMRNVNTRAKVLEKMSTSMGPKYFTVDRLLAIFYAILDEKVGITCNLLSQLSSLVNLKLLGFVSCENNVMDGSSRLQCIVGLDIVLCIGKLVGFNVHQYLCDFM